MLPIAQIDVVNQALIELGQLPVIQVTDTPASQLLAAKSELLLPVLLQSSTWNFAIKFVYDNTPLPTSFSTDFTYSYQLPADYGRFFKWSKNNTNQLFYEFIDGMLCTDIKPVQYYYIVNNLDYDAISTLFYRALAVFIAADSCTVLTNNLQLTAELRAKYLQEKSSAILLNDMERDVGSTPYNDFNRQVLI